MVLLNNRPTLARGCVWVITWDISRGSQLHDAETTVFLCKIQCWWWIDIHTEMCRSSVLEGSALLCMYWGREIPCMSDNWPWSSFLHWSGPETIDPLYKLALQERSQFDCVSWRERYILRSDQLYQSSGLNNKISLELSISSGDSPTRGSNVLPHYKLLSCCSLTIALIVYVMSSSEPHKWIPFPRIQ